MNRGKVSLVVCFFVVVVFDLFFILGSKIMKFPGTQNSGHFITLTSVSARKDKNQ